MTDNIPRLPSCIPIPLEEKVLQELIPKTKDWAVMHGIGIRSRTAFSEDLINFAPFILLPSAFPRKEFERAVEIQTVLNELMHRVAHSPQFLRETLKDTVQVDEFTAGLFKIYETVLDEGISQPLSLGLIRNDLMLDSSSCGNPRQCGWKQVEVNTIAAGFGWLGPASLVIHRNASFVCCIPYYRGNYDSKKDPNVSTLGFPSNEPLRKQWIHVIKRDNYTPTKHSRKVSLALTRSDYMMHSAKDNLIKQVEYNTVSVSLAGVGNQVSIFNRFVLEELGHFDKLENLPENNALTGITQGLLDAWKIYGKPNAAILVIVEDVTYNICDQRFHEFELRRLNPRVKIIRRTLTEVHENGNLSADNELVVDDLIISVVYYRSAYTPDQMPTKKEWDARLMIERSQAIKCPSIQYHLAGTKKVQQALAKSGTVEMFLSDSKKIASVKEVFTGLYGLDFDEAGNQAVQMALDDPERFVLKPQREGGGNNVYGEEIRDVMLAMKDSKERTAWILMERIKPPITTGYMVRAGNTQLPQLVDMVSELGVFGVVIGDSQKIMVNRQVGHMLRTKAATDNEGGVAAGLGALDSPYLVDLD